MIIKKQLNRGEETLVCIAQTAEEERILQDFSGWRPGYKATIERLPGYKVCDLVIRKVKR